MVAIKGSFEKDGKKYPTLTLKDIPEQKYGFTFGVSKAKMILSHVSDIEKFVTENR